MQVCYTKCLYFFSQLKKIVLWLQPSLKWNCQKGLKFTLVFLAKMTH